MAKLNEADQPGTPQISGDLLAKGNLHVKGNKGVLTDKELGND